MAQGDYLGIVMQSDIGAQGANGVAPLVSPALTGTPTAPTAADGTATAQIATTAFVQSANKWHSNPNLLDNWYFVGGGSQQGGGQFPINQRGQTSYSGAGYGIDRWKIVNGGTLEVDNQCIRLTNSDWGITQRLDDKALPPGTYTFSAIVRNLIDSNNSGITFGEWWSESEKEMARGSDWVLISKTVNSNEPILFASMNGNGAIGNLSIDIKAMKLELGDTQTLAHQENGVWVLNEIPNYQEQLARCQRYQRIVGSGWWQSGSNQKMWYASSFPQMAKIPTPVLFKSTGVQFAGMLNNPNLDNQTVSLTEDFSATQDGIIWMSVNISGTPVANQMYSCSAGIVLLDANL